MGRKTSKAERLAIALASYHRQAGGEVTNMYLAITRAYIHAIASSIVKKIYRKEKK
jgi:hypothetical protein